MSDSSLSRLGCLAALTKNIALDSFDHCGASDVLDAISRQNLLNEPIIDREQSKNTAAIDTWVEAVVKTFQTEPVRCKNESMHEGMYCIIIFGNINSGFGGLTVGVYGHACVPTTPGSQFSGMGRPYHRHIEEGGNFRGSQIALSTSHGTNIHEVGCTVSRYGTRQAAFQGYVTCAGSRTLWMSLEFAVMGALLPAELHRFLWACFLTLGWLSRP